MLSFLEGHGRSNDAEDRAIVDYFRAASRPAEEVPAGGRQ
jgi:plasmid stability protein